MISIKKELFTLCIVFAARSAQALPAKDHISRIASIARLDEINNIELPSFIKAYGVAAVLGIEWISTICAYFKSKGQQSSILIAMIIAQSLYFGLLTNLFNSPSWVLAAVYLADHITRCIYIYRHYNSAPYASAYAMPNIVYYFFSDVENVGPCKIGFAFFVFNRLNGIVVSFRLRKKTDVTDDRPVPIGLNAVTELTDELVMKKVEENNKPTLVLINIFRHLKDESEKSPEVLTFIHEQTIKTFDLAERVYPIDKSLNPISVKDVQDKGIIIIGETRKQPMSVVGQVAERAIAPAIEPEAEADRVANSLLEVSQKVQLALYRKGQIEQSYQQLTQQIDNFIEKNPEELKAYKDEFADIAKKAYCLASLCLSTLEAVDIVIDSLKSAVSEDVKTAFIDLDQMD